MNPLDTTVYQVLLFIKFYRGLFIHLALDNLDFLVCFFLYLRTRVLRFLFCLRPPVKIGPGGILPRVSDI